MNSIAISRAILDADLSRDDLNAIIRAINLKSRQLTNQVKRQFKPAQRVEFTNSRNGLTITGVVVKLMPKNVKVLADNGVTWTVSPGLLRPEGK